MSFVVTNALPCSRNLCCRLFSPSSVMASPVSFYTNTQTDCGAQQIPSPPLLTSTMTKTAFCGNEPKAEDRQGDFLLCNTTSLVKQIFEPEASSFFRDNAQPIPPDPRRHRQRHAMNQRHTDLALLHLDTCDRVLLTSQYPDRLCIL